MKPLFRSGLARSIATFSAVFFGLLALLVVVLNSYLPDYLLDRYIEKSRALAERLSRSFQDVNVLSGEKGKRVLQRIVSLDFPEEKNIVQIVVRDKGGRTALERRSEDDSALGATNARGDLVEEAEKGGSTQVAKVRTRAGDVIYYRVSSPIYKDGQRVGDVQVSISKKTLYDRIEIDGSQLASYLLLATVALVVLLTLSFVFSLRLFVKYKRSEEQADGLRRLAYVGELSSGLAHEIRNPLNALAINLQLLRERVGPAADEWTARKLAVLEDAKEHASRVLTRFLDFARRPSPARTRFDALAVARETLALVDERLAAAGAESVLEAGDAERLDVDADPAELKQVLLNLLFNAADALATLPAGRPRRVVLRLETKRKSLFVTVADSGPGMDDFTRENAGTPFFTKKERGTGLGLAVVRRIAEEYGGTLSIRSTEGEGSEVSVELKGTCP